MHSHPLERLVTEADLTDDVDIHKNPLTWKRDRRYNMDYTVQGCGISMANALEIPQSCSKPSYDDVIKWKHFPRYWPFVRGIHRSPVNSPHKGQWRRALMFSWIGAGTNGWANHWDALWGHCNGYGIRIVWCNVWHSSSRYHWCQELIYTQFTTG